MTQNEYEAMTEMVELKICLLKNGAVEIHFSEDKSVDKRLLSTLHLGMIQAAQHAIYTGMFARQGGFKP